MVERSMEDIAERRAIRAQRRQKQRLENVRRAEKMHAARLVARQIDFGYIADLLGAQMGCFLFQLPPSVRYSSETLHMILAQLDPRHRNVVEFRHKSWWNDDVVNAFRVAGVIFCSCSGPRLPDELVKTADDVYIRFHGVKQWYRHDYTDAELELWVQRIQKSGAKSVWAYFNNDRDGHAIKNAKRLAALLIDGALS